jgi:hypothetical protein
MKLRAARARLIATSALGLGVGLVLAAATLISRHFIESTAAHSRAPVLRPAAVFAPTLLGAGASDKEIDAVSGFVPQPRAALERTMGADETAEDGSAPHAPVPVPEELLLSLAPPAGDPEPTRAPPRKIAPGTTGAVPRSPAPRTPGAPNPPAEPRLEMIDENLWRP